jgi:uncharacterized protein with PIN domain
MSPDAWDNGEPRFLVDRMLGTLCRYLRLMGYDTLSANSLGSSDRKEDTRLLERAQQEGRILLTKDRELARRAESGGILIISDDVLDEIRQLLDSGLIRPDLRLTRCSLCNTPLRVAGKDEISGSSYAPTRTGDFDFYWCNRCGKLYWLGSHGKNLETRLKMVRIEPDP